LLPRKSGRHVGGLRDIIEVEPGADWGETQVVLRCKSKKAFLMVVLPAAHSCRSLCHLCRLYRPAGSWFVGARVLSGEYAWDGVVSSGRPERIETGCPSQVWA
jgi:hypothetical protein